MSRRRRKQPGGLAGGDVLTWGLLLGVGGFAAYQVVEELKERAAVKAPTTTTPTTTTPTTTTPATTTPTTTTTAPATGTVVGGSAGAVPVAPNVTPSPAPVPAGWYDFAQNPKLREVLGVYYDPTANSGAGVVPKLFPFRWIAKGGPSTQPVVYEQ